VGGGGGVFGKEKVTKGLHQCESLDAVRRDEGKSVNGAREWPHTRRRSSVST